LAAYRRSVEIDPSSHYAYVRLAFLYVEAERFDEAEKVLVQGVDRVGNKLMLWRLLADVQSAADKTEEAAKSQRRACELDPSNVANALRLAAMLHKLDRRDEAEKVLRDGLNAYPAAAGDWARALVSYYMDLEGDDERALELARGAVAASPSDPGVFSLLGAACTEARLFDEAIRSFRRALELEPGRREALLGLAGAFEGALRLDEAEKTLREWAQGRDDDLDAKTVLAEFLVRHRRSVDEAVEVLAAAVESRPGEIGRRLSLASAYNRLDRNKEALDVLKPLLKEHPENKESRYLQAIVLDDMGKHGDAEKVLREMLKKDPRDARAANALGYMFAELGVHLDEAKDLVEIALEDEPENGAYLDSMGWVYYKEGKSEEALEYLRRAAEAEPDDAVIAEHLGDVYARMGKSAEALAGYETAARHAPHNRSVFEKIRKLKAHEGSAGEN
jgi:tetratricopeptide (TPR) repeat protein